MTSSPLDQIGRVVGTGGRAALAYLGALCAGSLWTAVIASASIATGSPRLETLFAVFLTAFVLVALVAGLLALPVAAGLLVLAKRAALKRPAADITIGLIAGASALVGAGLLSPGPLRVLEPASLLAAGIGSGLLAGYVYWRLAGRPRGVPAAP